jgi:protein-S-isoprenylcysteine O-methyltransferase Ste14
MNILQPFNAVFFVGLVIYFWIRDGFIKRTKAEKKNVRRIDAIEKLLLAAMLPPVLFLPLMYLFTPFLSFADYDLPRFVLWCGVVVMIISLWLFWRSHVDLGQNWSVSLEIRENHELIQHGVYRHVRHPMYTSIWLWAISQALLLQNWFVGWSVVPAFAAMYFIRMPREERLMVETFGDDYRQYSRQTGRLFPRLRNPVEQSGEGEISAS